MWKTLRARMERRSIIDPALSECKRTAALSSTSASWASRHSSIFSIESLRCWLKTSMLRLFAAMVVLDLRPDSLCSCRRTFGNPIGLRKPIVVKLQNLAGAGNLHVHSLPQQFPTHESESVSHPGSGESKGSGRCKAPVERQELLGHARQPAPYGALARP